MTSRAAGPGDGAGVYLVLSHQGPHQLTRLVHALENGDPNGQVIVQHDHARCSLDRDYFAGHPRVHLMNPSPGGRRWGRYSHVDALLDAFRWALANLDFSWLAVLSGQDYPLEPLSTFRARLEGSSCDAFVTARPIPLARPDKHDSGAMYLHARYYYRWYELPSWTMSWTARSAWIERLTMGVQRRFSFAQPLIFLWSLPRNGGHLIGFRRLRLPFGANLRCYFGSDWMTLSRRALEVIDGFVDERTEIVRLYQRSVLPSESLLVTIVCNSPALTVNIDNHHYVRMTGGGEAHAAVLGIDDLDAALASGKPFARKFDERVDERVLDVLDERILGPAYRRAGGTS